MSAYEISRRICRSIEDRERRSACIRLISKILIYGDSVSDEVRKEFKEMFTDDERRAIRESILNIMRDLNAGSGDVQAQS
ncbi:MAG: hypothetical protein QW632_04395 [Ignisphaera sp.]